MNDYLKETNIQENELFNSNLKNLLVRRKRKKIIKIKKSKYQEKLDQIIG